MDAKELRKKLDEGLKTDVSGKTTPIQRLTPFLHALIDHLEEREYSLGDAIDAAWEKRNHPLDMLGREPATPAMQVYDKVLAETGSEEAAIKAVNALNIPDPGQQVSSEDLTRPASAQTNSEQVSAFNEAT